MDGDAILENMLEKLKRIPATLYLPLALGVIGLIFLCIGMIQLIKTSVSQKDTPPPLPIDTNIQSPIATLTVDVEGSVQHPGVYHLQNAARLQDALIAAGGLSSTADRDFVSKKMNLAAKLTDGGKVYIPTIHDNPPTGGTDATTVLGEATSQIDINSASADALDSLPGIGQVTAQKIINGRPYSSVDDLLTKKVVNQKVFNEIKDKVVAE